LTHADGRWQDAATLQDTEEKRMSQKHPHRFRDRAAQLRRRKAAALKKTKKAERTKSQEKK
jgi:hypothetical protein